MRSQSVSGLGPSEREAEVLAAAKAGDVAGVRAADRSHIARAFHLHCYRMLGELHDADDALQEALLRAWRGLGRFQAPSAAALLAVPDRHERVPYSACPPRARRASGQGGAAEEAPDAGSCDRAGVGPCPEGLVQGSVAVQPGPDVLLELNESIELAFVAAVQLLPARQRAVLLLRDVLGFAASEVAGLLGTSAGAVNSALQRARSCCRAGAAYGSASHGCTRQPLGLVERELSRRLAEA